MSTWTLEQIAQVERLHARLAVDDSLIVRGGDTVQRVTEDKMADALTQMAHPFAVELHRGDFKVVWTRSDATPWQVSGEMRWRPKTTEVELRGGHLDGQRWAVQKVGEPLKVARLAETPWLSMRDETEATAALTTMEDVYELAGWREDERVWVYAASR